MAKNIFPGRVIVESIELTSFYYDMDFHPEDDHEITYELNTLHRIFLEKNRVEVRIDLEYHVKGHDDPVLSGTCLTSFMVEEVFKIVSKSEGPVKWKLQGKQLEVLAQESVAHTRALLALHTAGKPLGNTHLAIFNQLKLQPASIQEDGDIN